MMSFFKNLLGISDSRHFPPRSSPGLHLIAAGDLHPPRHVLPSPAVKKAVKTPPDDPDLNLRLGFYDVVDGLRSCTESLGFESSDERGSEEGGEEELLKIRPPRSGRKARERRRPAADVPPPLTSMNGMGERSFFLRPEKKDGRLLLTEVKKIERQPEVLRACRQDGRLRLQLVSRPDEIERNDVHEQEGKEEGNERGECGKDPIVHRWPLPSGRCQDLTAHHSHHHYRQPYWSELYVTST